MPKKEVRLIDANALDTLLEDVEKGYKKNFLFKSAKELRWIRDAISALRTIDPESLRPKGKWIMRGGKRYCSHCGERACVTRDSDDFWYTVGTPSCPNCGARMEE